MDEAVEGPAAAATDLRFRGSETGGRRLQRKFRRAEAGHFMLSNSSCFHQR